MMPNLPALPSTDEVLSGPSIRRYGPYLTAEFDHESDTFALVSVAGNERRILAVISRTTAVVYQDDLDASTVPYVNKAIAHTGQTVIKNWRTKRYEVKREGVAAPVAEAPAPKAEALITLRSEQASPERIVSAPKPAPAAPSVRKAVAPTAQIGEINDVAGLEVPAKVKVKSLSRGYTALGDIIIPDADLQTLQDAWSLRADGHPAAVLITGPAGTAKTALVKAFAATLQVPFLKVDGGAIRTADDWAGAFRQDPETKTWSHRWSPFAQVLRSGGPAIVLVDELNRPESPQALNALLGLLDWTGSLLVPDANAVLTLPAGVLIVATANIGPEFVGTLPLDGAVRQRFPYGIRLDYPVEPVEISLVESLTGVSKDIAGKLVRMAGQQRINREDPSQYPSGSVISTRVILDIARRIATCGTDPRAAVLSTLRGQFDPGDEAALSVCVDGQFAPPVEYQDEAGEVKLLDHLYQAYPTLCCDQPEWSHPDQVAPPSATSGTPFITLGKHYFVAGNGQGMPCTYNPPTASSPCGADRSNSIHL